MDILRELWYLKYLLKSCNTINMKYLKWIWIASVLFFTGYCIVNYVKKGFDDLAFASWMALVCSGIGLYYRK